VVVVVVVVWWSWEGLLALWMSADEWRVVVVVVWPFEVGE